MLTDAELATLNRLRRRLDNDIAGRVVDGQRLKGFRVLRNYYRGMQRLEQIGLAVPEELRKFTTIVAWPRTYVDAIVSRLHPQGFLLDGEADADLWRMWQANDLDSEFRMALIDMLVFGRGYLCVGEGESEDTPLITVESPMEMIHEWSNRHRKVTAAARFYSDEIEGRKVSRATLYLPDVTIWATRKDGKWVEDVDEDGFPERDPHGTGRVLVRPLVNRAATDDRYGESEMLPILTLTDAAARALTNTQVATEVMALPQRWVANAKVEDFKDPATGAQLDTWETYFGAVWAATGDAKFGQFSAASLDNFKTVWSMYAQAVAGLTGLPMRYMGQLSDNPPSADGIRADESRLIGTAEEKQEFANGTLEGTMRDSRLVVDGVDDPALLAMETDWRPAATPTVAQTADAAVKEHAQGLISRREALRMMGKSPKQIEVIEGEIAAEEAAGFLGRLTGEPDVAPVGG